MLHKAEPGSKLDHGLRTMGLEATHDTQHALIGYLKLLQKWNRAYNLTAVRDVEDMVSYHLLDSLSIQPFVRPASILDVGSGAGLPGIPLAIWNPDIAFTLLDSNEKKVRFLRQTKIELSLGNLQPIAARVETFRTTDMFDLVISRAFASLKIFVNSAGHLCSNHGQLLAMKGKHPTDEIAELPTGFHVEEIHRLNVPGLEAERHLVVIQKID